MSFFSRTTPTELKDRAARVGLHVSTWSPGDGQTRYRFMTEEQDYFAANGYSILYTALGLKEANTWLKGYEASK